MAKPLHYVSKDYVIRGSLVDLSRVEDAWNGIDKRIRTSVRKGERMGVVIRPHDGSFEEWEKFRTFTPNDDDMPAQITKRHHAYVAEAEGTREILGWILLAEVESKLFLLCHASTSNGKERQTPNLLLWHAIRTWCGSRFKVLDVGASYRPSLQKYFKGFQQEAYPMVMNPSEIPLDLRITPFDTAAYGVPLLEPAEGRKILVKLFGTEVFTVFPRAMHAIAACLREYRDAGRLTEDDEVYISTTTNSPYISSCVTRAIESVCKWSQQISDRTRAVFLIHEFGFPNPHAWEMRRVCTERSIPLIEDLAYGWGSDGTGMWGDVRIYSATKLLPLQFGGFLVGMQIPHENLWHVHGVSDRGKEAEILGGVAGHWPHMGEDCGEPLQEIREGRQMNWDRYAENLSSVVAPYFELPNSVMPGAFIAKLRDESEMRRVSAFVRRFGVEAGNWYHHGAIFLPCHQRMTSRHVDFVCGAVLANFREGCGVPRV